MDSGEFALLFLYTRNLTDYSSVIEGPMVAITIPLSLWEHTRSTNADHIASVSEISPNRNN